MHPRRPDTTERGSLGADKRDTGRAKQEKGEGGARGGRSENSPVDARRRNGGSVVGVIATGGGCLLLVLGK